MVKIPHCPSCNSEYAYLDRDFFNCPECGHEWSVNEKSVSEFDTGETVFKDAHGTILQDGDTVIVIKDLKVKGSSLVVKGGTKVKNIRLVDGDHDIDCKIPGIGAMQLKTEFVKKSND